MSRSIAGALLLSVFLGACATPLDLPPDYRERSYDAPGTRPTWSASTPLERPELPPLPERLGLAEAKARALLVNHDVKAASATVSAAIARIGEARAAFLPTVQLSLQRSFRRLASVLSLPGGNGFTISPSRQTNGAANLRWSVFAWGRDTYALDAARAQASSEALGERAVKQELLFRVAQAWYGIHEAESNVEVARQALEASMRQKTDAENLERAGRATHDQVLTAEVNRLQNQQDLLAAQNAVVHARRVLNTLLDRPVDAELVLDDPAEFEPVEIVGAELSARSRRHNPQLLSFRTNRLALEKSRESIVRSWMPEAVVSLGGTTTDFRGATGFSTNWTAILGLEWAPVDGGRRLARIEEIHAQLVELRHREQSTVQAIELEIHKLVLDLSELESLHGVATQSVAASEENYRIVNDRFKAGRTTSRELLEAVATRSRSRFALNQARFQYQVALARLESLVGLPAEDWRPIEEPAEPATDSEEPTDSAAETPKENEK